MFKYYVLNYNFNSKRIVNFNIFSNYLVDEATEKCIKKYLRSPGKYKFQNYAGENFTGYEALCEEIRGIISWQERSRREYEISVGDLYEEDLNKYERKDCYDQAVMNLEQLVDGCIKQYKKYLKGVKPE